MTSRDAHPILSRQSRNWVAPDGTTWRLALEPSPRHLIESHDRRRLLVFTSGPGAPEKVRFVPEDFLLDTATDAALDILLRAR